MTTSAGTHSSTWSEMKGQDQWLHGEELQALVALSDDTPVDFLAYVVQQIGPDPQPRTIDGDVRPGYYVVRRT